MLCLFDVLVWRACVHECLLCLSVVMVCFPCWLRLSAVLVHIFGIVPMGCCFWWPCALATMDCSDCLPCVVIVIVFWSRNMLFWIARDSILRPFQKEQFDECECLSLWMCIKCSAWAIGDVIIKGRCMHLWSCSALQENLRKEASSLSEREAGAQTYS